MGVGPRAVPGGLGAAEQPVGPGRRDGEPFATVINSGASLATGCGISLGSLPAAFTYQTTDPSTNLPTGMPNTPVSIPAGGARTFFFAIAPTSPFGPTDVQLVFDCDNTPPAQSISGINTLLLSASATPVPDLVALAATASGDGVVVLGSTGAFSVATVNVGAGATITASGDTGTAALPVSLLVCQTNPTNGQCVSGIAQSVTVPIGAGETPTFSIFVNTTGSFSFDPAANRAFVRLKDAEGVTRGSTSVALKPPSSNGLAGTWRLTASGTTVSDSGDRAPFSLSSPPFAVTQTGNALSGSVIVDDVQDVVDLPLPSSCSLSCGTPGSCSLTWPGLRCSLTCVPATAGCGERLNLTGTVSGAALDITVRSDVRVDATCTGVANGTLFAQEATVINGQGTVVSGLPHGLGPVHRQDQRVVWRDRRLRGRHRVHRIQLVWGLQPDGHADRQQPWSNPAQQRPGPRRSARRDLPRRWP